MRAQMMAPSTITQILILTKIIQKVDLEVVDLNHGKEKILLKILIVNYEGSNSRLSYSVMIYLASSTTQSRVL